MAASATAQERRDWALFSDWCASVDRVPIPADAELIAAFLDEFSGPTAAHGRRMRAIRLAHERAGLSLDLPTADAPSALREGPEWATVPRALAQLPTHRHRKDFHLALRGRRDGWLITLIGVAGFSREQARTVLETDVALYPALTIRDRAIERSPSASECPACAVTRWLRVAGPASFGWTNEVKEIVSPALNDPAVHDCATGLDGTWRQAQTLLPHIDRHGWVSAVPMSARAISATMAARQIPTDLDEAPQRTIVVPSTGRFATATRDELADAYDDVDAKAAAMLLQLKALVDESDQTLDRIKAFSR